MVSNQSVPFLSNSSDRLPTGAPGLNSLIGYSVSLRVFGSNLEMKSSPKSEYQTMPSASTITSCGSVVGRGKPYSVMMTRVARPLGRGKGLSEYSHWGDSLRLTLARDSLCLRHRPGLPERAGSSLRWGLIAWLTGA